MRRDAVPDFIFLLLLLSALCSETSSLFFYGTVFFQPMTFYSIVVKDIFLKITSPCKEQCGLGRGSGCTWSICHRTILLKNQQKDLMSLCLLGVFSLLACLNLLNSPQQHWDCVYVSEWSSRTQLFLRSCFFFSHSCSLCC